MIRKVQVLIQRSVDGRLLLLQRPPQRGSIWQPVTGKARKGEKLKAAARRELAEETGIREPEILVRLGWGFAFETPRGPAREDVFLAVVARHQPVRISGEHVDFRWVTLATALGMVEHTGVRVALRKLKTLLGPIVRGGRPAQIPGGAGWFHTGP